MTPPLLRWRLNRDPRAVRGPRPTAPSRRPKGGWLRVDDGVVDLAGEPPSRLVAPPRARRRASRSRDGARPGPGCSTGSASGATRRCGGTTTRPSSCSRCSTEGDVRVVAVPRDDRRARARAARARRGGRPPSQRPVPARPGAGAALLARRPDPELVATDPSRRGRARARSSIPSGCCSPHSSSTPSATTRRRSSWPGASRNGSTSAPRPSRRSRCSSATRTCCAPRRARSTGSRRSGSYPIAIHLEHARARPRALPAHARARRPRRRGSASASTSCSRLVLDLLDQPDVTGLDARNLVERRRAEALRLVGDDQRVVERIEHAPARVPAQPGGAPTSRARPRSSSRCPAGAKRASRVRAVDRRRQRRARWRIEVAARDRPGLLATVSGRDRRPGLDILDAAVATWGDGAALDSFLVRRAGLHPARLVRRRSSTSCPPPDPVELESAIVDAFDEPARVAAEPRRRRALRRPRVALVHDLRGAQPRPARAAAQPHRRRWRAPARACTRRDW